jgi:hypothetical protein
VAPEPAGSSLRLQEPATGHYPEPAGSTLHPSGKLPKIHSDPILPSTPWSSKWSLSYGLSHQNPVHFHLLSHACHMSRPPHSSWFDLPNDIWGWVQNMKLLIVHLPPFSCYSIHLWSKYNWIFRILYIGNSERNMMIGLSYIWIVPVINGRHFAEKLNKFCAQPKLIG